MCPCISYCQMYEVVFFFKRKSAYVLLIIDLCSDVCSSDLYALNREFVGYGGLNIDLLEGRFRNRFGYGYTNTSRDNYNPARSRPQTFDSAGRNERLEYQGSLSITQGLTAL